MSRMTPQNYEKLLRDIGPRIVKFSEKREPISPEERLCNITLSDSQISLACSYWISPTSTRRIIKETCNVIWDVLQNNGYIKHPA